MSLFSSKPVFASLEGKKALVTGGTRGIGRAIVEALRDAGATVTLVGTNPLNVADVAKELKVNGHAADLSNPKAIEDLVAAVGAVDILVNNAGITRDGMFVRQSDDQWGEVMRVNVDAAVRLTRALLPGMTKAGWGRVINITSIVAHMGNVGQTNYIASKAALTGFSMGLAKEVGRKGVTVNSVAPGFIETAMTAEIPEKVVEKFKDMIPVQAFGKPEDVAAAVRFLASNEAQYVTGSTLHVNGGMWVN
jgi:NAD(P)-dependent dehydrogenase (short-subunit alcohol dehydrogenase family)